jgi:RNA polymerase sigma-70 factor (ECF subfamily)
MAVGPVRGPTRHSTTPGEPPVGGDAMDLPVPAPRPDGHRSTDVQLVAALRAGDDRAFATLVDGWSGAMHHVARGFVSSSESAQDVVQDTWIAVIRGLDRFEGRSSLRTWVFRILVNTAKTRGVKEHRTLPFASVVVDEQGPTVDPSRFGGAGDEWPGGWTDAGRPHAWEPSAESLVLNRELQARIDAAISMLPERQRLVVVLRDVQGFPADEVCELLELSSENQRVLLHRGRAKVRAALEDYYREAQVPA